MIVDLDRFIKREKPYWRELETAIDKIEEEPLWKLSLIEARRLHYLFERASASLVRINTFSNDPSTQQYVESLVARGYGIIHSLARPQRRFAPVNWFLRTFPRTFRKHIRAFALSVVVTVAGAMFGAFAITFDPDAKSVIVPFEHLQSDPAIRVEKEESAKDDRLEGSKASFASMLMTHNIRISVLVLALGLTLGIGTITLLFYNGVILGAIAADYIIAGKTAFLLGWLLPHGAIEIPAILLAGQAGLVLASALIGRGERTPLKLRLREVTPSLVTLIFGTAVMLIWAGIIEAVFSQYHEPLLPYSVKIAFGCVELLLLILFLAGAGRSKRADMVTD